jgi:hypothetical protein
MPVKSLRLSPCGYTRSYRSLPWDVRSSPKIGNENNHASFAGNSAGYTSKSSHRISIRVMTQERPNKSLKLPV